MVENAPVQKSGKRLRLRPSDAGRWTTCTASPFYIMSEEDNLPVEVRDYTDEGSRAHELAATLLQGEIAPVGTDPVMLENVIAYRDYVLKKLRKDDELIVEDKIHCYYNPAQTGYIDSAIIKGDCSAVFIDDFKYGAGVSVQARGNKQLAIYARSFMDEYADLYDFTDSTLVTMGIFQPRIAGEEAVRLWVLTYGELKQWTDDHITDIAADILENPHDQMFAPSEDACRFCPAAAICEARRESLLEGMEACGCKDPILKEEEPFHPPAPESLSNHQIASLLQSEKELVKWLKQVRDYATDRVFNQKMRVPGFKTVAGTKRRVWSDEDKALEVLKTVFKVCEVTTAKVVSPTQVEKLVKARKRMTKKKKEEIFSLVTKPTGAPTLVPESDKRDALMLEIEAEFDEVIAEEDIL